MGQVLYRKYRSRSLDEIIGQEHITTTLKNALKSGAISHAYLFTGPRGVGKTSIARILAHELNELPYTGEGMHLDIIEIDAASNRGIDEIRDLREKVTVAPAHGKYKVYIIDEVHMLTTPAFNALLKTLEEPPAHVVFILATTESHKLPETIISRTQRYNFRPVEQTKVVAHLQHIATEEGLTAHEEALTLIAQHGDGSFRDSISLLNQAASRGDVIDSQLVQEILGLPPKQAIEDLLTSVAAGNKLAVVTQLSALHEQGFQAGTIAKQLAALLRAMVLGASAASLDDDTIYTLMARLIDVPTSNAPERLLEITLLQASPAATTVTTKKSSVVAESTPLPPTDTAPQNANETVPTQKAVVKKNESVIAPKTDTKTTSEIKKPNTTKPTNSGTALFDIEAIWPELLQAIKITHNTVYGILRMAIPSLEDTTLTLTFKFAFHQKRLQEPKHRKIIGDAILQLTGEQVSIECAYDKDATQIKPTIVSSPAVVAQPAAVTAPIATISNIFGGAELLES